MEGGHRQGDQLGGNCDDSGENFGDIRPWGAGLKDSIREMVTQAVEWAESQLDSASLCSSVKWVAVKVQRVHVFIPHGLRDCPSVLQVGNGPSESRDHVATGHEGEEAEGGGGPLGSSQQWPRWRPAGHVVGGAL